MPLKLTVGLSKKVGQPDYGSLGASCHVEVELDSALLRGEDLGAFHAHVRHAFSACGQAVDEELRRRQQQPDAPQESGTHTAAGSGNSRSQNGAAGRPATNGHAASQKQLDYAARLAGQIHGLGERRLDEVTAVMFRKPAARLSGFEASALIDQLKAVKAGQVRLEDVLRGTPA